MGDDYIAVLLTIRQSEWRGIAVNVKSEPSIAKLRDNYIVARTSAGCRVAETVVAHPVPRDNRRRSHHGGSRFVRSRITKGKSSRCMRRHAVRSYAAYTKEMNMFQQARFLALVPLLVATALGVAACGGGSSGMPATSQATSQMNQMKLSVADAPPAGHATHVVVVFTRRAPTRNRAHPGT